jgi:primosomal protein N' (replication factor Y)
MLSLPPFGALARVSGPGSADFVADLAAIGLDVGRAADHHLVRAADWMELGARLNATERPPGSRIRIEIDPARV